MGRRSRRRAVEPGTPYHVYLVASSGGHLAQLMCLEQWWGRHRRTWVSFGTPDVRSRLEGERLVEGHHPTTRNIPNLLRNAWLAAGLLWRERPDVVVSDGAGLAVPFFVFGWLLGVRTVYIEVYDRIDSPTVTARLVRPFTDLFLVQWPEQLTMYPGSVLAGPLY